MSSEPDFSTTQLDLLVDRLRTGDRAAADELLRRVGRRLERLARAMLRRFPAVRRWEDTGDLLQNATLRLLKALEQVRPASTRDFFGLAALQLRRELVDLARRHGGPEGLGANYESAPTAVRAGEESPGEPPAPGTPEDLDRWSAFHEAVDRLPAEEREVVGLVFYHGWSQAQAAELLGVAERTVRRRWRAACVTLVEWLGDDLPLGDG